MVSSAMNVRDTYVRVLEAAEILGVVPNTVRKWGAAGKIPEYRHPANGYRLYKREELEAFMRQIRPSNKTSHKKN
jgi:MerR family transcriptional regulator, copper efflux regulator